MKRTRKWSFVAQEAARLVDLGLSPKDIAARLGVNRSSVTRWMATGKLPSTRAARRPPSTLPPPPVKPIKTPGEWARNIRETFDLDATDEQLVTVAESALALTVDGNVTPQLRLQAAGRFQAVVKQLALVARAADAKSDAPEEPKRKTFTAPRRSGVDPRGILSGVQSA